MLALGQRAANESIWRHFRAWRIGAQIDTSAEARRQHAKPLLQMAMLLMLLRRYFGIKFPSEK